MVRDRVGFSRSLKKVTAAQHRAQSRGKCTMRPQKWGGARPAKAYEDSGW